jgi:hypothetical protein
MAAKDGQARVGKFEAEVDLVLDSHQDIAISPDDWRERGSYDFLYRKGQYLVADRDLDRAQPLLRGARVVDDRRLSGVTLLQSNDDDIRGPIDRIDKQLGPGIVTPNHVLSVCPGTLCPATEPRRPASKDPYPAVAAVREGKGVRVAVVDTGFLEEWRNKLWLNDVIVDPADIENPDSWPAPDNFIDPYAGHGTFIAGIVRCIAPGAEVSVEQVIDRAGVVDEAALIEQLDDALSKSPDVISFSAGGYTRHNVPPKALVEFYENRIRHLKGLVVVAAAGNDADRTPFWPAAFPWAVSVGALDKSGRNRAWFSNYGGWVDVYAPGEALVNAYASGTYRSVVERHLVLDAGSRRADRGPDGKDGRERPAGSSQAARGRAHPVDSGRRAAALVLSRRPKIASCGERVEPARLSHRN